MRLGGGRAYSEAEIVLPTTLRTSSGCVPTRPRKSTASRQARPERFEATIYVLASARLAHVYSSTGGPLSFRGHLST